MIRAGYTVPRMWQLIDVDQRFEQPLMETGDAVHIGDALACDWQGAVVTNPPFSLLDEYVRRVIRHVDEERGIGIVLTRGQWPDEPGRRWLRETRLPHLELRMCWRVDFAGDGHSDNATYAWWVWLTGAAPETTTKVWLERPRVSDELVEDHRRWSQLSTEPRQHSLEVA
ncbi:MAG: hypothetical protein ABIL09_11000 [Gemmatimonadota bacterium]